MTFIVNKEELAWAAGFFDGEGHVGLTSDKRHRFYLFISIAQTDTYVLERFRSAVGEIGRICKRRTMKSVKHNQRWDYVVTIFESCQAIIAMMWPWLSPVKRKQASNALLAVTSQPRAFTGDTARSVTRRRFWDTRQQDPDYKGRKLTVQQVREIHKRRQAGANFSAIAREFDVSWWTISGIIRGRAWKHVKL